MLPQWEDDSIYSKPQRLFLIIREANISKSYMWTKCLNKWLGVASYKLGLMSDVMTFKMTEIPKKHGPFHLYNLCFVLYKTKQLI